MRKKIIQTHELRKIVKRLLRAKISVIEACKSLKFYLDKGTHRVLLITLSFRDNKSFIDSILADGLNKYLTNLRRKLERKLGGRKDFFYVWILEPQIRLTLHYHILLVLPKGVEIDFPDKSNWYWGSSNVKTVNIKLYNKMINYLVKSFEHRTSKVNYKKYTKILISFLKFFNKKFGGKINFRLFGICNKLKTESYYLKVNIFRLIKMWFTRKFNYTFKILVEYGKGLFSNVDFLLFDETYTIIDFKFFVNLKTWQDVKKNIKSFIKKYKFPKSYLSKF